jgi:hypothetical protein
MTIHNHDRVAMMEAELAELAPEDRDRIAKHLFDTADAATRLSLTVEGLKEREPGKQPFELFTQMARIAVLPTYEAAIIRPNEEKASVDILMKQRKSEGGNQDWWEGQWHVPGTVMLSSDEYPENFEDFSVMRNRLFKAELGDALEIVGEPYILPPVLRGGDRGKEVTVRELMLADIKQGKQLPDNTHFFEIRNVLANPPGGGLVGTHAEFLTSVIDVLSSADRHRRPPLLLEP